MNVLNDTDKAYLAGFIDGEGYIGIVKQKKYANRSQSGSWLYHPWVVITSTDPNIINDLYDIVSIGKKVLQRRTGVYKDAHQLKITNHGDIINLLTEIKPYLRIKKVHADLLIKFCLERKSKIINTGRGSRGKTTFGIIDEKYFQNLKILNKKGK